jgi:hypothetical protein
LERKDGTEGSFKWSFDGSKKPKWSAIKTRTPKNERTMPEAVEPLKKRIWPPTAKKRETKRKKELKTFLPSPPVPPRRLGLTVRSALFLFEGGIGTP